MTDTTDLDKAMERLSERELEVLGRVLFTYGRTLIDRQQDRQGDVYAAFGSILLDKAANERSVLNHLTLDVASGEILDEFRADNGESA